MPCNCNVCVTEHQFFSIIAKLSLEDREWMETFYDNYCNEGMNANVNQCVIDGTWPNADDIIKNRREKLGAV